MRRYFFSDKEIADTERFFEQRRTNRKWLPAALALAVHNAAPLKDARETLCAAVSGYSPPWQTLQTKFRVDLSELQALGLKRDSSGQVLLQHGLESEAYDALFKWLTEKYDLDKPSPEDRIEALERQVASLTATVRALQAGAATTA